MSYNTMYRDAKHLSNDIGRCLNEFVLFNPVAKSFVMSVDGYYVENIVECIHNPTEIRINVYLPPDIILQIADFYRNNFK